ncbi:hypothetical protein ABEF95_001347 [Exophiala dermatitidis]
MASGAVLPLASSPLSSPPPSQSFSKQDPGAEPKESYREPIQLPFELAQHVRTYYEESLFAQAFNFLLSITGNSASSMNRQAPVMIPPASHLALAATLSVHPNFTSRTNARDKWEQAAAARRLLRLVHTTVGPVNANFATAFSFRRYEVRSSRYTGTDNEYGDDGGSPGEHSSSEDDLNTPFAGPQALWLRAEDFWHVVGWAFDCASLTGLHTTRWDYYSLLLEFMVDVLETDWRLRTGGSDPSPEESLIWQYIELAAGGHARARRILRAIFADGGTRSTSEFRAIFPNELKEPVEEQAKPKKREVDVDIEQDIYGDYLAQDESDLSDPEDLASAGTPAGTAARLVRRTTRTRNRTPSSRRLTPQTSTGSLRDDIDNNGDTSAAPSTAYKMSDPTSLDLRLRLMRLLVEVSSHPTLTSTSPTTFPDLEELLTLFVEFTKPLPLPVFARIVLPSTASTPTPAIHHQADTDTAGASWSHIFQPQTLTLFCESLLQRILENSSPSIRSHVLLSQDKLENEYLPFAAGRNSIDANARVSLLLESLTRSLALLGALERTEKLTDAVKNGVERRLGRVVDLGEGKRQKKLQKEEQQTAWTWLAESGERMIKVVEGLT